MLKISHISKSYGKTKALCDLSFEMADGVYGLLGPNGSGKTTLMNIITGNIKRDDGEIIFGGEAVRTADKHFRARIGYMPQYCEMIPAFSCIDFMNYMAVLKGTDGNAASAQINELLARFELDDFRYRKISSFSGGMKQRLMLAQAFLGEPDIVLLDEPTAGLDPKQRVAVKNFISEQSIGKTILIATHIISDLEHIACGVICLKKGAAVFEGKLNDFAKKAEGTVWEYTGSFDELQKIRSENRVLAIVNEENGIKYRILSGNKPYADAISAVPTPEDAYMLLYGDEHEIASI